LVLNFHFYSLIHDLEMFSFAYTGYGKEYIKSQKLSPDSYIQMAIQYAFYRYFCPYFEQIWIKLILFL